MKRIIILLLLLIFSVPAFGTDIYYSIRPAGAGSGNDLKVACNISISSGIATFSAAQTGDIGVGCYVSSSNVSGYISEMTDSTHAKIITATGGTHANVSSEALGAIYHPFASLSAADSGSSTLLGFTDLTTNNVSLYWPCYGATPETGDTTFNGYTNDSDHRIKLYTPQGGIESINNWRHSGVWDTAKFHCKPSSSSSICMRLQQPYMIIEGLQVSAPDNPDSGRSGIYAYSSYATEIEIRDCVVRGAESTTGYGIIASGMAGPVYIENNVIYNWAYGIVGETSGTTKLYVNNNTIINCNAVGMQSNGYHDIIAINNVTFGCTDSFKYDFDTSSSHNAYDEGTDPGSNGIDISGYTSSQIFSNVSVYNYNLILGSPLIDVGTTISGVTTDIISTSRPQGSAYDIGAFEYIQSGGGGTILPLIMHHYNMLRAQ